MKIIKRLISFALILGIILGGSFLSVTQSASAGRIADSHFDSYSQVVQGYIAQNMKPDSGSVNKGILRAALAEGEDGKINGHRWIRGFNKQGQEVAWIEHEGGFDVCIPPEPWSQATCVWAPI